MLGCEVFASFSIRLILAGDSFEVKKISSMYLEKQYKSRLYDWLFYKDEEMQTCHRFHSTLVGDEQVDVPIST